MRKPVVLVFIDWFYPGFKSGGPATSLFSLINLLSNQIHFKVVTRNYDYMESDTPYNLQANIWLKIFDGFEIYYLPDRDNSFNKMKEIISHANAELYYINGIFSYHFNLIPLFLLKKSANNVIISSRGMLAKQALAIKWWKKKWYLILFKNIVKNTSVKFHASSKHEAVEINQQFGRANIHVIFNTNDLVLNSKFAHIEKFNTLRLLYLGRISPEKNLHTLLHALALINLPVSLTIVGKVYNEQYFKECIKLIKKMPTNITIDILKAIEKTEIENTIQLHHALVLPSLSENFGQAVVESLACGRPVIVSENTLWKDYEDNTFIKVFNPFDAKMLGASINQLYNLSNADYQNDCKRAFDFTKKEFSAEQLKSKYLNLFSINN